MTPASKEKLVVEQIVLTDEQKLLVLNEWNARISNPPSITELVAKVWPDLDPEFFDARSRNGRAIKQFLASKDLKVKKYIEKNVEFHLTREHKEYVDNNAKNMTPQEIAKVLFPGLSFVSRECRALYAYYRSLPPKSQYVKEEDRDAPAQDYNPPNTLDRVCAKINRFIPNVNLDFRTLSPKQKKCCLNLINYLGNTLFKHQIGLYTEPSDRTLLEGAFIDCTWNKPDLETEDIHQYLILATEKVMASSIQRTIVMLEDEQKLAISEDSNVKMGIVDSLKNTRDDLNQSIKRQQSLYKALTEERSKRLGDQIKENATVLNIVTAWKNQEERHQIIKLAKEKEKKLHEELDKIETMDDLKTKWLGMSREEFIEG